MKMRPTNHSESGIALIVVMALLAIILIYVTANIRTLNHLQRDLKLIEQKQQQRLKNLPAAPPAAASPATQPP